MSNSAPVTPRRVLVVDDNRDFANTLTKLLEHSGHRVLTAYDAHEAIEAAAGFRPEVMLVDIGMPELTGYDVARRVRSEPWGKHIVLAALTGWNQPEDRAREAGFDAHFVKPVEYGQLAELLGHRAT